MRILHISDLHFGIESDKKRSKEEIAVRRYYVNDLVKGLGSITKKQPIDYILITGDIVRTATREAYEEAGQWLENISGVCKVPMSRIYLCPGNHDVNGAGSGQETYPKNQKQANELLGRAYYGRLEERFRAYYDFCRGRGLAAYELNGRKNYLTGVAVNPDVNIVCINTAWFPEDDGHKKNVWVGSGLVELIRREKRFVNGHPTIAIMHHPVSCWNEEERTDKIGSLNVYHELCKIADMILTGHTHEAEDGYVYRGNVYICGNGAVYRNGSYRHNFHMYEWNSRKSRPIECNRTVYGFDNGTWHKKSGRIKIETKRRRESAERPLRYSFSVLWWTR